MKISRKTKIIFSCLLLTLGIFSFVFILKRGIFNNINFQDSIKSGISDTVPYLKKDSIKLKYTISNNVVYYLKNNGKYILVDSATMIPINNIEYDTPFGFNDGVAVALRNKLWGYIDKSGKEIVPCGSYLYVYDFQNGYGKVKEGNDNNSIRFGFVNKLGKLVVPVIYQDLSELNNNSSKFYREGKYGFVNSDGVEITTAKFENAHSFFEGLATVELNGKWGYIDGNGKEVIPAKYLECGDFHEGLAFVKEHTRGIQSTYLDLYGFINKKEEMIIPQIYFQAKNFNEGIALVEDEYRIGKFIDKDNNELCRRSFTESEYVGEGLIKFVDNMWKGFANIKGDVVIPAKYDFASEFHDGLCRVALSTYRGMGEPFFFINKTGEVIINNDSFSLVRDFHEGLAIAQCKVCSGSSNCHQGFINKMGHFCISPKYDIYDINTDGIFRNGFARVHDEKHSSTFLIDKTGREFCDH